MRRYALRDDRWDRIKDIFPGREWHVGGIPPGWAALLSYRYPARI